MQGFTTTMLRRSGSLSTGRRPHAGEAWPLELVAPRGRRLAVVEPCREWPNVLHGPGLTAAWLWLEVCPSQDSGAELARHKAPVRRRRKHVQAL